jgi:nitrite reductase (NADH) small subunit
VSGERIGRPEDVPLLEGRSVAVGDRRIAVFNTGDGFVALDANCPHRSGPLSDGLVADGCVTCPLHGWRLDLHTGEVVAGGEGRVRSYEVVERDGELFVLIDVPAGVPA